MRKLCFLMMLSLLDSLVFAVPVYVTVEVPVTKAQGVKRVIASGVITDSTTYHKAFVRGLTSTPVETNSQWGKVWLGFDLTDTWATYDKAKLHSAAFKFWAENGTGRRFSVAGLTDGFDESWTQAGLTWTTAPGNDINSGMAVDFTKVYGGAPLWVCHDQILDSKPINLAMPVFGGDFDQSASYESIDSTSTRTSPPPTAANTNLCDFLKTDTDGKVTLIGYDHTNSSNQAWYIGEDGYYDSDLTAVPPRVTVDGLRCRDEAILILSFPPLGADNPSPYPGDIKDTSLAQLSWTNPDPNAPWGVITPTVYFGVDPNRLQMESITLAPGATSVAINTTKFPTYGNLQNLTTYYWTVDCADSSDQNIIEGLMWNFFVNNNNPPVVDAGPDQGVWNDPNLITVNLNATVTDDGLPIPPGALTYLWTRVVGPTSAVINSPATKNTTVTLYEYGKYEFHLAANDGGVYPDQTDRVVVAFGKDACEASHILTGANYYSGDFNRDCIVNLEDLAFLAAGWLNCTDTLNNCGI